MRYSLIVKGMTEVAMESARKHGILDPKVTKEGETNVGCTIIEADEPDSKDLYKWFTEDAHLDPPFPAGSLLNYREAPTDEIAEQARKRLMKEKHLTEEDTKGLAQLVINNQIAWVRGCWARGEQPTEEDLQWLRDRGVDPETLRGG